MTEASELIDLEVVTLAGSPRQMGRQFGEAARDATRRLYELRLSAAMAEAAEMGAPGWNRQTVLDLAERCLPATREYDRPGWEEFCGLAEGAGLSQAELYVTHALTDLRDVLTASGPPGAEGCSSLMVDGTRSADGQAWLAQTWDLRADNLPFVRLVHRQTRDGSPATWSLTLTGCLSLIGINDRGLAVGTTNLRTGDARRGVNYLTVIHRALRAETFEEAVSAVRDAPRSAGHYFYLGGPEGQLVGLECSASRCVAQAPREGAWVHCNHALSPEVAELEVRPVGGTTHARQRRLESRLAGWHGLGQAEILDMLGDHAGGSEAICRHAESPSATSTNACVILCPQQRLMAACRGQAHAGRWQQVGFGSAG